MLWHALSVVQKANSTSDIDRVYSVYRWDYGRPELPPILAPAIGYRALGVAPPSVATASFTPAGHNRRCWFGRGSDGFRPNGWIFAG
jgi:hypothetical protein